MYKQVIDTQTDTHTDAGDDNTQRPKLASGKNEKVYNLVSNLQGHNVNMFQKETWVYSQRASVKGITI